MVRLNRALLALLVLLVVFASVSGVVADSGSGSVVAGDDSPTDDFSYTGESNSGSLDSDDDVNEDPLDEEYYDSNGAGSGGFSVSLSDHATANPLLVLLLALVSAGVLWIKN